MVTVHTFRATDIAVIVIHRHAPRLAAGIHTTASASFRVLDGDVVAIQRNVALLVVAGFLLGIGRVGRYFLAGIGYILGFRNTFCIVQKVFIFLAFGSYISVITSFGDDKHLARLSTIVWKYIYEMQVSILIDQYVVRFRICNVERAVRPIARHIRIEVHTLKEIIYLLLRGFSGIADVGL